MRHSQVFGEAADGLYLVEHSSPPCSTIVSINKSFIFALNSCFLSTSQLWHCRLGHLPFDKMKCLDFIPCKHDNSTICDVCPKARLIRQPFPRSQTTTSAIFDMLQVDIWGPYKHPTHDGHRYFLTIVDDHSRATWTHLFFFKHNAFPILQSFIQYIKNHFKTNVKIIRSDNGKEFGDTTAMAYYSKKGITHQTTM